MLHVRSIPISVSEMGLFPSTVLLPKQQFRVPHTKLPLCFAVISACLSLSLSNLIATYTSKLTMPIA